MCKFESGLTSKKCKLFLGRVRGNPAHKTAHLQTPRADTQTKVCKRAVFINPL